MATYKYTALGKDGNAVTGVIKAKDEADAVIQLKNDYSIVQSLREIREYRNIIEKLRSRKVSEKTLALLCEQFSIILEAGMPIVQTVELVAGQMEDRSTRKLLLEVSESVSSGISLTESFFKANDRLPATFIETVRAGESSGSLSVAFGRLAKYYKKRADLSSKVITALTYPFFVLLVAIGVITVIMVRAVPVFASTFASMGTELPLPTRILMSMSDFFVRYTPFILIFLLLLVTGIKFYESTEKGRYRMAELSLKLPALGRIQLMNASSQFANTLSTMLAAGLPARDALDVTGRSLTNHTLSRSIQEVVADVEAGFKIGHSMRRQHRFPPMLIEMTAVGEASGSLEKTLSVVAEYYDMEAENATNRAVGLLEPVIIVVLAVFVVFVLLAVYLPMFSMYGAIG